MKVIGITVPIFTQNFESTVKEYEILLGQSTEHKFDIASMGLSVAKIGSILVVCGSEDIIDKLKQIRATLVVDSIDEYYSYLVDNKATILQPPTSTPTGQNMIAKGKDGVTFEYVELKRD